MNAHPQASVASSGGVAGLVSIETTGKATLAPGPMRFSNMRERIKWVGGYFRDHANCKAALLTLTYAKIEDWKPDHVKFLCTHIRKYLLRKHGCPFRYVWVAELQERGAVHYHLVIWLPRGVSLPKADKQGWWPHGWTNVKWATRAVGYLLKYASKLNSKGGGYPKGLRLHGSGGLPPDVRRVRTWRFFPTWLRNESTPEHRFTRAKGGGWVSRLTGEILESPWIVTGFGFLPGVGRIVHLERRHQTIGATP